ncbi:MAG TPA: glycosyltransferase [Thermoanaerobaculia bacterium]|nr:glycosyltransferase [Thermoanaerobaculia bacterium]
MRVVAGITACNEERTIGPLLDALLAARPAGSPIEKIIVVSSACRDGTDGIVREFAARDSRVTLIAEPVRRGKAAAINTFLAARPRETDVTVIASADVLPFPGATESIVAAFADPAAGMAGGRPVPQNEGRSLTDRMAQLMWDLHDRMARRSPKLGELVAFRSSLVSAIDEESPVDESSLEAAIRAKGARLVYVPEARIANRGPATMREWMSQRRRIAFGHLWLKRRTGYSVSTGAGARVLPVWLAAVAPRPDRWIPGAALVVTEVVARWQARRDLARGSKDYAVGTIAESTKAGTGAPKP